MHAYTYKCMFVCMHVRIYTYVYVYVSIYVCIYISTVIFNSRDGQGKLWLPQISHFQQPP